MSFFIVEKNITNVHYLSPQFYLFIYLFSSWFNAYSVIFIDLFHFGFLDKILSQVVEILTRNWRGAVLGRLSHLLSRWFQTSYLIDAHLHKLEASLCSINFTAFLKEIVW